MRNKWSRAVAVFLVMSIFISSFCGVRIVQASETDRRVISGDGYCITIREQSSWTDGFIAEFEVKNTGNTVLKNWNIVLELSEGTVVNAWNAKDRQDGNQCFFECMEYNRLVDPGESVFFGCQVEGADFSDMGGAEFRQKTRRTNAKEEYEAVYRIVDQWDSHANIEVEIYNHTSEDIEDWNLLFDFSGIIENIWNADIISDTNGSYRIENKNYNATIRAGGSEKFGFVAKFEDGKITCPGEGVMECAGGENVAPKEKSSAVPAATPSVSPTQTPNATASQTPEADLPQEDDEDFDPETDAYVYHDVENRDWNMEMIHADSDIVKESLEHPNGAIRVALLDSGVNYSDEVYVSARKNFVPGEDDYSELYEDVSGHGTAIAEVLASNPNGTPVEIDCYDEEDTNRYTYYDEEGNVELPEAEDEEGEEPQVEGSLLEVLESGYEWNQGVNPTVDLISAKILDENEETTVDRVAQAIDWAIENDSDIISMSFGMEEDSAKLHKAIQKAYDAGILMVAAAGNGDHVEYPAAYPEVMAVGSVDSLAEQAEQSASGKEVEVVAPGEFILSRGAFDSMQIFSGTSMAVPHVAGLASILWQKDTSKSADFIRQLIDATARECGTAEESGYGLIDCEYALEHYGEFETQYEENPKELLEEGDLVVQMENTEEIDTDEGVRNLYGSWKGTEHRAFVSSYVKENDKVVWGKLKSYVEILKTGVTFVDNEDNNPKCQGMHNHPWFHGYYGKDEIFKKKKTVSSNYVASYYYLYILAKDMYEKGTLKLADTSSTDFQGKTELQNAYKGINEAFKEKNSIGSQTWEQISSDCAEDSKGNIPKKERSLLLFGMALHTVTDTYAHSTFAWGDRDKDKKERSKIIKWKPITHTKGKKGALKADSTKYVERRYKDAKRVAHALMAKINLKDGKFLGFAPSSEALTVYSAQKDYNGILKSTDTINVRTFEESYAMKRSFLYAKQMKGIGDNDDKVVKETENKLQKIALDPLQKKIKKYRYNRAKNKIKKKAKKDNNLTKSSESKSIYVLYNDKTGKKLMKVESDTHSIDMIISNDSELKLVEEGEENKVCCRFDKGKVFDAAGKEIPELDEYEDEEEGEQMEETEDTTEDDSAGGIENTSEDDPEDDMEDDPEEMCEFYCFEFEPTKKNAAYRIEMTWEDSALDLDLLMMAMFPYADQFYLTCRVEKTTRPELGDVFQSDETRASLDRDVMDASGAETITIHNFEEDAMYLFIVRNYTEDYPEGSEREISASGAMIKVYRGQETTPIYLVRVPRGKGYYWNALCLWGDTGELQPINTITKEAMG